MMEALLSELKAKKIKLRLEAGQLKVDAPKGVMTQGLLHQIKTEKQGLIEVLEQWQTDGERVRKIPVAPSMEYYPLTHTQKRLWISQKLQEENLTYHISGAFSLHGELFAERLEKAFGQVVEKYEILRTVFGEGPDGTPFQKVMPFSHDDFRLTMVDFSGEQDAAVRSRESIEKKLSEAFQLQRLPLIRMGLVKVEEHLHYLYFSMHHIVSDGWSMEILVNQLLDRYRDRPAGNALRIQYKDVAVWQKHMLASSQGLRQKEFWLDRLRDEIPALDFPAQKLRPVVKSTNGAVLRFPLTDSLTDQLNTFSRKQQSSLFTTLFAGLSVFFYRYTSQRRFVIGTPAAGRSHADLKDQIGPFINLLPLVSSVDPDANFATLCKQAKTELEQAFSFQDYPFDLLVEQLGLNRDASRAPLFDVMISLREDFVGDDRNDSVKDALNIRSIPLDHRVARYDLTFNFIRTGSTLSLNIEFNTDIFDAGFIDQAGNDLRSMLEALVNEHDRPVGALRYGDPVKDSGAAAPKLIDVSKQSLMFLLEQKARECAEHIAVSDCAAEMTYAELMSKASCFADFLQKTKQVKPGDFVVVQLPRTLDIVWSLLGIWNAGAVYVPVDPDHPRERVDFIREDCGCMAFVDQDLLRAFKAQAEFSDSFVESMTAKANDPAYMIYTSGTTGKPKGVILTHGNLNTHARVILDKLKDCQEPVKMLNHASCAFDISLFEIFMPLLAGGELVLLDRFGILDSQIQQEVLPKLTHLHGVPSFFDQLFASIPINERKTRLAQIRHIFIGGDAVSTAHLEKIRGAMPNAVIHELYGPTEASIWCASKTYHLGANDFKGSNIGRAAPGHRLLVLDEHLQAVPQWVVGELCVGGSGVAQGYLNRPELSAEKFIDDPWCPGKRMYLTGDLCRVTSSGDLEFVGRKDDQFKLNGYRIEKGEVERTLEAHASVDNAVVVLKELGGETTLVAYLAASVELNATELRRHVLAKLPEYMLPKKFVQLRSLPLTANGKLDVKALDPNGIELESDIKFIPPSTDHEQLLAGIWKEALRKDEISIKDSFFNLGGDSIKSIQVVARLKHKGFSLKVEQVLKTPVLEDLARLVEKETKQADQSVVTGEVALTPVQHRFFEEAKGEAVHHKTQSVLLRSRHTLDFARIESSLETLTKHHDALRMRFRQGDGHWRQFNLDSTPPAFTIEEFDLRESQDAAGEMTRLGAELHTGMNIENGPMLKAVTFRLADGDRLLLVVHHLVVDGVSWRILLEDFVNLYTQHLSGQSLSLPLKSDSFKRWAAALQEYAGDPRLASQRDYWEQVCNRNITPLSGNQTVAKATVPTDHKATFSLNEHLTNALLSKVHKVYNTEINDILLTALGLAIRQVFGVEETIIEMEGHGREESIAEVDLSRTVGWFTSVYPFVLAVPEGLEATETLIRVKENLRQIPAKGIGYGVLRYLSEDFAHQVTPSVSFNFLGDFENTLGAESDADFRLSSENVGAKAAPQSGQSNLLDVSGMIAGHRLHLTMKHAGGMFSQLTINQLSQFMEQQLADLIKTLEHTERSFRTPSDFTYKGLSIDALSRLEGADHLEDIYKLSPLQEGIYFHWLTAPDSTQYFEQISYRLRSTDLHTDRMQEAYEQLIQRHAALRTSFTNEWGILLQFVHRSVPVDFSVVSSSGPLSVEEFERFAAREKEKDRAKGFRLGIPSPMRLSILSGRNGEYECVWSFHHILMDGWCMRILISDFYRILDSILRNKPVDLPPPVPYSNYIEWLDQVDQQRSKNHWKALLENYSEVAAPPFATSAAATDQYQEQKHRLTIKGALLHRISKLCQQTGVTHNTFAQCVWGYLLARYNNSQDVVFGTVVSGRPGALPGVEEIVGLFINSIPVRVRFKAEDTVGSLLQDVQRQAIEGMPHHFLNLSEVQAQSEFGSALINHLLVFENYPVHELRNDLDNRGFGAQIVSVQAFERTNYDFNLVIAPSESFWNIDFKFNAKRFDPTLMAGIAKHFERLIELFSSASEAKLAELHFVGPDEHSQLATFNKTDAPYPMDASLMELFQIQVDQRPEAVALSCAGTKWSYRQLDELSIRFANYLRSVGIGYDSRVVISLTYDQNLVAVMLAAARLGALYIPVDAETPAERIKTITESSGSSLCINPQVLEQMLDFEAVEPLRDKRVNSSFCIIYTSGSTGKPKGSIIEAKAILNRLHWMWQEFPYEVDEVCCVKTSISFVDHICELLGPLLKGVPVVVYQRNDLLQGLPFLDALHADGVSRIVLVPSLLKELLKHPDRCREKLGKLHHWVSSGEALQAAEVKAFYEIFGREKARLINIYGSTEVTADATYFDTSFLHGNVDDSRVIPIGKPIGNVRVLILDSFMRMQPIGIPGEMYVAGAGLSKGYVNDATLNNRFSRYQGERVFRTGDIGKWLPDGNVCFLGRVDDLVKVRGNRVEPGEIEKALLKADGVAESVVIASENGEGETELVAYYTHKTPLKPEELRKHLQRHLPSYMIPVHFLGLDRIPLTVSGKIDRQALPRPSHGLDRQRDHSEKPLNAMEKTLVAVWEEVLGMHGIGVLDNFFELGGHSLKATRIMARVQKEFGIAIDLADLFDDPTIRGLAGHIELVQMLHDQEPGNVENGDELIF